MELLKNIITGQKALEVSKRNLKKDLLKLKNKYPIYLSAIDNDMEINYIEILKSPIQTITFYKLEILSFGEISYINIPSNINYIKTLEYELLRSNFLNAIKSMKNKLKQDKDISKEYYLLINDIKTLKKNYSTMYRKETNIFKDEIIFLYNLKNTING